MIPKIDEQYKQYGDEGRIEFITFHPSYSYEEFVEGITVEVNDEAGAGGQPKYILKEGIFKKFCKKALGVALKMNVDDLENKTWKYVFEEYQKRETTDFRNAPKFLLIIDEINRGDMAKIFGELITLLEADKRLKDPDDRDNNELIVRLPMSGDQFGVPPNLYIIATMNTADRSIALLDIALRRRFGFVEMNPDFNALRNNHVNLNQRELQKNGAYNLLMKSIKAVEEKINPGICDDRTIGRDRQIGHSFFFKVLNKNDLFLVWRYEILPLLEEYCYNDYGKINFLLSGRTGDSEWIKASEGICLKDADDLENMLDGIIKQGMNA